MRRITLAGLLKIELPGHTVLLCDGGTVAFAGDTYSSRDSLFGTVKSFGQYSNGVGEAAPSFMLTFLPDPDAASEDLNSPAFQGCRLRMWIVEIDEETGEVLDDDDTAPEIDAIIDVPRLRFPESGRTLEVDCVSVWVLLLDRNDGNVLNGPRHKLIYSMELGLDGTTGVTVNVPWGTKAARGIASAIAGIVGGGGTGSGIVGGGSGGGVGVGLGGTLSNV